MADEVRILTGEEARKVCTEILANNPKPGDYVHREAFYPVHFGSVGYFLDKSGDGKPLFACFDNSTGDCWCEDFKTRECAEKWCKGEMQTDELRCLESNVEEIILIRDSFPVLKESGSSVAADCPMHVQFDENGEMPISMQLFDGYAYDTNLYGLTTYDRIGLYYPTVNEVASNPYMQDCIREHTGRVWSEGSPHEQIFDIALTYGEAGRLCCPDLRYEAAVDALVERVRDASAKAFTDDQRKVIDLAAGCAGYHNSPEGREFFFDMLFLDSEKKMSGVPMDWKTDAREELNELSQGKVRGEANSLRL